MGTFEAITADLERLAIELPSPDAVGLPVLAGPVEATALGNVLVQARARGAAPLEALRARLAASTPLRRYDSA